MGGGESFVVSAFECLRSFLIVVCCRKLSITAAGEVV